MPKIAVGQTSSDSEAAASLPRTLSPDKPRRQRPPSPLKYDAEGPQITVLLEALAQQERIVRELKEQRDDIDSRLKSSERKFRVLHSQLATLRCHPAVLKERSVQQLREDQSEPLSRLAEGGINAVTAIWHDVVNATMGQQAKTNISQT
ncbi:hypothetical protein MRB53_041884 [Persea americana]|nr:hypothetical protein MRB53_041884 [Persea americana]